MPLYVSSVKTSGSAQCLGELLVSCEGSQGYWDAKQDRKHRFYLRLHRCEGICTECVLLMQVFLTAQYLAIAMEYAAGGDMFEHVVKKGGLKESEARWFFQQLIVGVDYIHRMVRLSGSESPLRSPRGAEPSTPACQKTAVDGPVHLMMFPVYTVLHCTTTEGMFPIASGPLASGP